MLIITCLSLTVGFLPECLLICSCAVQLMGPENSALRKHRGSLAVPHVPNSCFTRLQEGKKISILQSSDDAGAQTECYPRNALSKMAWSRSFGWQFMYFS